MAEPQDAQNGSMLGKPGDPTITGAAKAEHDSNRSGHIVLMLLPPSSGGKYIYDY